MSEDARLTVLYLDDEEDNLFIFNANFRDQFNIITVVTPEEAMGILENRKGEVGAVISDMRMPKMDGVSFVAQIKKLYPMLSCFILTGFDNNERVQSALESGLINKTFHKPFDIDDIRETLSQIESDN